MEQFFPPKYKEITHIIFEKETGHILGTEQQWILEENISKSNQAKFIKVIAESSNKPEEQLDTLVLDDPKIPHSHIEKIDVKSRKPVLHAKVESHSRQSIHPQQVVKP